MPMSSLVETNEFSYSYRSKSREIASFLFGSS